MCGCVLMDITFSIGIACAGDAYIDVTYKDDTSERILCAELSVQVLINTSFEELKSRISEMKTVSA